MAEEAETSFWDVGSCRPLSPQPAGPPREAPLCSTQASQSGQQTHSGFCSLLSADRSHFHIPAGWQ